MSNKAKDIDIKNRTYYFLDDIIKIKYFGSHNTKIDEKSYTKVSLFMVVDILQSKIVMHQKSVMFVTNGIS